MPTLAELERPEELSPTRDESSAAPAAGGYVRPRRRRVIVAVRRGLIGIFLVAALMAAPRAVYHFTVSLGRQPAIDARIARLRKESAPDENASLTPAPWVEEHSESDELIVATIEEAPASANAPADSPAVGQPVVEAGEMDHHFGVMELGQTGTHEFEITNSGDAPLKLLIGRVSCKCTFVDLPPEGIPAGGMGRVRMEWKAEKANESFRHGAILTTNDPQHPELSLSVSGKIRVPLASSQEALLFPDADGGERNVLKTFVYSQTWTGLDVRVVGCSMPGVTWQWAPATDEERQSLRATAAHVLRVQVPSTLPQGAFQGMLTLEARAATTGDGVAIDDANQAQPWSEEVVRRLELPIQGEVPDPMRLFGPGIEGGLLDLGRLPEGEGAKRTLMLLVRGAHKELEIQDIQTNNRHVTVSVERAEGSSHHAAKYLVHVQVDPGTPIMSCMTDDSVVRVVIQTDHPQRPLAKFRVAFSIGSRTTLPGFTRANKTRSESQE